MKYYTVAEATKPELLSSLRAASKLASLKHLMLLFLHFAKKLYGFSAMLLYNVSQHPQVRKLKPTKLIEIQTPDGGKPFLTNLSLTSEREWPPSKITRRARRDGTRASNFAGFER